MFIEIVDNIVNTDNLTFINKVKNKKKEYWMLMVCFGTSHRFELTYSSECDLDEVYDRIKGFLIDSDAEKLTKQECKVDNEIP